MGVTTDAYLYFGFDFYDEENGIEDPEIEQHIQKMCSDDGWYDLTKDHPHIDVNYHCSHDYPVWFICIEQTLHTAKRGHPVEMDLNKLRHLDASENRAILKTFCDQHGIPWQEPKWILASYWG